MNWPASNFAIGIVVDAGVAATTPLAASTITPVITIRIMTTSSVSNGVGLPGRPALDELYRLHHNRMWLLVNRKQHRLFGAP